MGLFKAAKDAVGGILADQWREFFYCDSMDDDILVTKGKRRGTGKKGGRGSNNKGSDNVISDGSIIAVNEGQCMMIVDQGQIMDVCAQAGEYVYDSSSEPSLFTGDLGESIQNTFKEMGKRFAFGGEAGKDQRVYFFNVKEIMNNRFGTASPIPFRIVDTNIGLDIDISIRCNGMYSFQITDPLLFYQNVCGNVTDVFGREEIAGQLKAEMLTALQPAFAEISAMGVRYSAVPAHTVQLAASLNKVLSVSWKETRGIEMVSLSINSITASEEDEDMIKDLQRKAVYRNAGMAAANLSEASAEAMKLAAANTGTGAMMAFAGMNMASAQGGLNMGELYAMDRQEKESAKGHSGAGQTAQSDWTCSCGAQNTGKFCTECGKPRPAAQWVCTCGAVNTGKFCTECGKPMPAPTWQCSCGAMNQGKFCSACGKMKE
jgi:membrane protease subunit (stomatin/prohibitin family)